MSAVVGSVNFLQVFYSLIADVYIFNSRLKITSIVGSIAIFTGIVLVNMEKQRNKSEKYKELDDDIRSTANRTLSQSGSFKAHGSLSDRLVEDDYLDADEEYA